jgi:ribonucleoside-diphosphate reductase alpha chain
MDNIIDRAEYPLPEQGREARAKRRMGLGVTGTANALEAIGHRYGSPGYVAAQDQILALIRDYTYQSSVVLAQEKGAFAKFDRDLYCEGRFVQTLPADIQTDIARYGIRNSHLTSIAPTGTISLCADNVSSGIEPVFAYSYDRTIIQKEGPVTETIEDYGVRVLGVKGKRTLEVTIDEHLDVLLSAARHVDSAVSKTCNVGGDVSWEDFKSVYVRAHQGGAKGCTTFRVDGKRSGVLVAKDDKAKDKESEEAMACTYDPSTGRRTCE